MTPRIEKSRYVVVEKPAPEEEPEVLTIYCTTQQLDGYGFQDICERVAKQGWEFVRDEPVPFSEGLTGIASADFRLIFQRRAV